MLASPTIYVTLFGDPLVTGWGELVWVLKIGFRGTVIEWLRITSFSPFLEWWALSVLFPPPPPPPPLEWWDAVLQERLAWAWFVLLLSTLVCCQPTEFILGFFFIITVPNTAPQPLNSPLSHIPLPVEQSWFWVFLFHNLSNLTPPPPNRYRAQISISLGWPLRSVCDRRELPHWRVQVWPRSDRENMSYRERENIPFWERENLH